MPGLTGRGFLVLNGYDLAERNFLTRQCIKYNLANNIIFFFRELRADRFSPI
jgi:hypothetical protein